MSGSSDDDNYNNKHIIIEKSQVKLHNITTIITTNIS